MDAPPTPGSAHAAWGRRFGWIAGGIAGLVVGFALTYGLEVWVLRSRVTDPTAVAARVTRLLVPTLFVAGALGGHAFGGRGGAGRYKALGVATGVALVALAWFLRALAR